MYSSASMRRLISERAGIRCSAPSASTRSARVRGSHAGTGLGLPSASFATKMRMQVVAGVYARVLTSADDTVTTTCMLVRPVCTSLACTSTRLPGGIGRR